MNETRNSTSDSRRSGARRRFQRANEGTPTWADADLNQKIVAATIRLESEVEFRTADAAGLQSVDDLGVLEIAARDRRILVSHDKSTMPDNFAHFIETNECPGVLIVPRGLKLANVAEELVMIWEASEAGEWVNIITYIPL